ncbi:TonB-dependent receptor domain-containing protein [Hymenobacter artigasi]|uniref:Outer membrane receptor for ferrienterochelin and colicin n=1 Tax=Hymenobacter artigasi TaxID=2719616 RepID=A0ABX1HK16_9BACT|nr:TonB-dependent receptor [Hymenobacter artigasi]NKI90435.1 outer membrane receptor for ferrienterochelin and colicin [Hymenobacter artigasi]
MKFIGGIIPHLRLSALLLALLPAGQAAAQSSAIAPVRGEVTEAGKATPLPGAVLRWLYDAADAGAPVITTTSDGAGHFVLMRPARAASRLVVQALGYRPDTLAVPATGAPYLRVGLRAGAELGEVVVTDRAPAYSSLTPANVQMISGRDLTKSACCNLAESFETNASVEVTTSDAVSGAKQIQLLGLDGSYSLLTVDNQPALRGLAAPYRLGYLAGPWIENIEIIKGTGSVVNGYEAISGQVNVKLKEPEKTDQLLFNAYANDLGKFDVNLNASARISPKWSTVLLLHTDHLGNRLDRNKDGFIDLPLATQFNAFNKWKYLSGHGIVSEVGLGALRETRQGGQFGFRDTGEAAFTQNYGTTQTTTRYTGYAKTSYTWPARPFQSLGLLLTGTDHDFTSRYSYGYQTLHTGHDPSLPAYFVGNRTSRAYDGNQRTGLATLLFQSALGNTAHVYRTGLSFLYDNYDERLTAGRSYSTETPAQTEAREHRLRRELVPGAFAEYTYQNSRNLTVVAGLRADRHNLYGWQITPRLNVKYDVLKNTVLRAAAGSGFRVANPIADNAAMLASAREFVIGPNLRPEKAWNMGGSATQYFTALGRPATFILDYYHTEFSNQVVADMYTAPSLIIIDNLQPGGRSLARSLQAELQVEPLKGLQVKGAYKYLDVRTTYDNVLLPKPLTPAHRAFLNLGYASAFDKWRADFTVQWFGQRPVAHISSTHGHGTGQEYAPETAPRYALLNTQLTRAFKRLEVYAGVENLTNYRQPNPIEGAANPFGPTFDAAMVWGPVYGRVTYAGLRYRIE